MAWSKAPLNIIPIDCNVIRIKLQYCVYYTKRIIGLKVQNQMQVFTPVYFEKVSDWGWFVVGFGWLGFGVSFVVSLNV